MATRNPNMSLAMELRRRAEVAAAASHDELVGSRGDWWWTGRHPTECPGFDAKAGVLRSLALPNSAHYTRQQLLDYFDNCWTLTEVLFSSLQGAEAFTRQPYHQLRHPMMFYYVHPAVVYINKLRVAGLVEDPIDPFIEQLFEVGVDEMSWDDLSQAKEDWPPVRAGRDYRASVYKVLRNLLETHPDLDGQPITWETPTWAVVMGFEHERIHLETSSVLIRELPLAFVRKPEYWPEYHPSVGQPSAPLPSLGRDFPQNNLVEVAGGKVVLGKPRDYPSFGFDNEYGRKEIQVPAFRASQFKVTNGEFHAFVKAGGYMDQGLWSEEGWGWKTFRNVKWPTFWVPDGPAGLHRYKQRLLFDAVPMRWDWPVDVNYHEATAYLAWRTRQDKQLVRYRMVTEAEHQLMRRTGDRVDAYRFAAGGSGTDSDEPEDGAPAAATDGAAAAAAVNGAANGKAAAAAVAAVAEVVSEVAAELDADGVNLDPAMHCTGANAVQTFGFNVQLAHGSASPVTALPPSGAGFYDVFGSAWEWGEDHFAAFPGFKEHRYYEDFSSPCFAGLHHMIIGGSFISTGQLASKYARYQFRPHFFQHATFRVVQTALSDEELAGLYDMSKHAAGSGPILPFFETSCMDAAPPYVGDHPCCSKQHHERFTPTMDERRAADAARLASTKQSYETDFLMSQYLSLHFGPLEIAFADFMAEMGILSDGLDFPRKCADFVVAAADKAGIAGGRALDLGCAVGRSTFELAHRFQEVVGIDISQRFIDAANEMKEKRRIKYKLKVEGDIFQDAVAAIDDAIDVSRTTFLQGDACALPQGVGQFEAVLAANLICRVPDPAVCLAEIDAHLAPGGVLVLTLPFTWMEEYTERSKWVGGRPASAPGGELRCADALKALMAEKGYSVMEEGRAPLVIRETVRKYQLILAHKLVFQKARAS